MSQSSFTENYEDPIKTKLFNQCCQRLCFNAIIFKRFIQFLMQVNPLYIKILRGGTIPINTANSYTKHIPFQKWTIAMTESCLPAVRTYVDRVLQIKVWRLRLSWKTKKIRYPKAGIFFLNKRRNLSKYYT